MLPLFIFLDIDGVGNSTRSALAAIGKTAGPPNSDAAFELATLCVGDLPWNVVLTIETIDPVAVALINRLVQKTSANVVLSSSHRSIFNDQHEFNSPEHLRILRAYIRSLGFNFDIHGITPRMFEERGKDVATYLEEYEAAHGPIGNYVILDDGRDFKPHQHLIWCDPKVGFSAANYYDAMKQLGFEEQHIVF
jgi:hypothetical protein